jgi:tetratricopeptide (TPR) repeat protein
MTRSLQEIVSEVQTLDLRGKGIKRYYELSAELYSLLPGAQAEAILSEGMRGREKELLQALANDVGDQRAKDLIDQSYGEYDSKRAIALLHRALRYGRTTIQAHKAYSELGSRYESRGNISRAIMYYTRVYRDL